MSSLFADTHNVVAILEKSDAAEGFEQIIDFLSGSYIHYALTVNPHIYISCIKQFWNTASVKRSGDVTRLQSLIDKKKTVIFEVVIREILQLDNAEGVVWLPNEEIFAGLAQIGYEKPSTKLTFYKAFFSSQWKFLIHTILQSLSAKRTSWNEFSTVMASAMICLSKGQKFSFSKYIFDSLNQVGDLSTHTTRFISPALTQKVFANIRRVGKGFSGVETPLFEGMLADRQPAEEGLVDEQVQVDDAVAAAVEENVTEDVVHDVIPSPQSHDIQSLSQEPSSPPQQPQSSPQAPPQGVEFLTQIQQVLNLCSALTKHVENLENNNAAQKLGRMIDDMDNDEGIELVKDADIAETEGRHATEQAKKQAEIYHIDRDHSSKVLRMQEDDSKVQEVVEVVTTAKLITDVVTAAALQVSAASETISAAKPSIPVVALTVVATYTKRRKGVIIKDPKEELPLKTPAETPKVKDKGKCILVETLKPMKKKDQIELDAEYARKLHEEINRDHEEYQGMKKRPQTESEARVNTPRSDEDRLKLMELMVFLLQKGFWNTASIKRSGDLTRLQALVDKKKILNSEVVIREILQLDDAEGVVCLPNEEIFTGLAQMGYEKPSTKLTFYKAFFSSQCLVRNVDSSSKFYMDPRFIYLIIQNQVGDLSTHTTRFISPALTQKVFANIKRVGKGFSRVETPLFEGMLADRQLVEEGLVDEQVQVDDVVAVSVEENVAEDVSHDAIPSPLSHDIPSPSQEPSSPPQQPQSSPQAPPQDAEFPTQIQKVLNVCSALTKRIENLENDNAAQKLVIIKLKARVKRLEKANMVKSSKLRRLRKVGASKQVESYDDMDDVFNQGRMIDDMDKDERIKMVKDVDIAETEGRHATKQAEKQAEIYHIDLDHSSKVLSMQEDDLEVQEVVEVVTTAKLITDVVTAAASQIELDAEYARKLPEEINKDHEEFNKDIDWDAAMDHKAAKRRKLSEEAQEAKDLRKRLEVADDEDDDVFIEATSLTRKVPVVDYQIVLVDNKPRFKIIKADETHQLYISFTTLLKNFDREDLENL
nr:hypothetical protein [Tanacetum cinerariifolium]